MLHMLHVHACFYAKASVFRSDSLPLAPCSGLFTAARKSPRQRQTDGSSSVCACKGFTGLTNCSHGGGGALFTLPNSEWNSVYFGEWESVKENDSKGTPEEVTSASREGQINGNADKV